MRNRRIKGKYRKKGRNIENFRGKYENKERNMQKLWVGMGLFYVPKRVFHGRN